MDVDPGRVRGTGDGGGGLWSTVEMISTVICGGCGPWNREVMVAVLGMFEVLISCSQDREKPAYSIGRRKGDE